MFSLEGHYSPREGISLTIPVLQPPRNLINDSCCSLDFWITGSLDHCDGIVCVLVAVCGRARNVCGGWKARA